MKTSIIYLGIALLTFSNVIPALSQESFIKGESLAQKVSSTQSKSRNASEEVSIKRNSNAEQNVVSFDPEAIAAPAYEKTIEEIIAENNLITESSLLAELNADKNQIEVKIDGIPSNFEKTTEERILEDSQIIESQLSELNQMAVETKTRK
ncbi:hypothetical protein LZZ90_06460 [Flavobacterium sp. SM15]|uniref:hypothetical protein n=1 Tax=Flavobacterium sp. SM15 TaxID=2908005 RepID=UPI001EDB1482|nr:hypothetical protein [Flavobacterium sp. SM15]MCG2611144.1 hypothetical protein [Flavobacterium sp. SM15]